MAHTVPTSIRSISTQQIPTFASDLKSVQITLSPAATDHSDENAQKKSVCNPQLFKTAICRTYSQFGSCPYEHKCRFAHGLSDLRPVPRFKSMSSAGPTSAPTTSQIFNAFQKSGDDAKIQRSHSTSPVLYPIKQ
ncbi:hypothetical protein BVRB_024660 [Beta vulgaris subsp. vulgaris]|uniref:C3H1-type domain-containing protein n=1 Tax=Beta vulgaris subsp. vulgaris TaxID=3555 RepID=A0A0J8AZB6_BETVV|nr:hypothetical protein BVRB_024660 [Beta vulgaris subsp. vulgaris]